MKHHKLFLLFFLLLTSIFSFGQEKTIVGIVKLKSEPVAGAMIYVKNKQNIVSSDIDGKFSIKVKVGDTLGFTYVNCNTFELPIKKEDITNFVIQLSSMPNNMLDYGPPIPPKRKNNYNQAIVKVSKAELTKAKRQENKSSIADTNFIGKTYKAQTGIACKEFKDGGCTIYYYCILKFDKDSVKVSNSIKANCTPSSKNDIYEKQNNIYKKYKWHLKKDWFIIDGFEDYKKYSFSQEK
jgi:CarboxypepD_reg-like domain